MQFAPFSFVRLKAVMQNLFLLSLTDIGKSIVNVLSGLGIWYHVLYNFIGATGIVIKIIGFQLKKRNIHIAFNMCQGICWMLYFICTGNATAGVTGIIGIVQNVIFMQREKHKWADSYFWLVFFLCIQVGITVWSVWDGVSITEIFPLFASPFGLIAYFVIKGKVFRSFILMSSICWFTNSLIGTFIVNTGANLWMAFICDVLSVGSIIIAILRFDILKKVQDEKIEKKKE